MRFRRSCETRVSSSWILCTWLAKNACVSEIFRYVTLLSLERFRSNGSATTKTTLSNDHNRRHLNSVILRPSTPRAVHTQEQTAQTMAVSQRGRAKKKDKNTNFKIVQVIFLGSSASYSVFTISWFKLYTRTGIGDHFYDFTVTKTRNESRSACCQVNCSRSHHDCNGQEEGGKRLWFVRLRPHRVKTDNALSTHILAIFLHSVPVDSLLFSRENLQISRDSFPTDIDMMYVACM